MSQKLEDAAEELDPFALDSIPSDAREQLKHFWGGDAGDSSADAGAPAQNTPAEDGAAAGPTSSLQSTAEPNASGAGEVVGRA